MKRFLTACLALGILLCGCGQAQDDAQDTTKDTSTALTSGAPTETTTADTVSTQETEPLHTADLDAERISVLHQLDAVTVRWGDPIRETQYEHAALVRSGQYLYIDMICIRIEVLEVWNQSEEYYANEPPRIPHETLTHVWIPADMLPHIQASDTALIFLSEHTFQSFSEVSEQALEPYLYLDGVTKAYGVYSGIRQINGQDSLAVNIYPIADGRLQIETDDLEAWSPQTKVMSHWQNSMGDSIPKFQNGMTVEEWSQWVKALKP